MKGLLYYANFIPLEININNKITFLGVQVYTSNIDRFPTSILIPVPFHYKRTIIKTLNSRAKQLSSSRIIFLNELKNIKQTFINNAFPNNIIDAKIKHFINKTEQYNIDDTLNYKQSINLHYKKQVHINDKIDEHILKNVIQKLFFLPILSKNKPYRLLKQIKNLKLNCFQ